MSVITVIREDNRVYQFDNEKSAVVDNHIDHIIMVNEFGKIIVNKGNPITWPTGDTDGMQAIVDVKAGTLRFAYDGWPRSHTEFVVSEYVEPVKKGLHSETTVVEWPEDAPAGLRLIHNLNTLTSKFEPPSYVLKQGEVVGAVKGMCSVPPVTQAATREEVITLVETWPIHLERNGEKITEDWVWGGLNGVTVIVNQISGKTITESDWRNYLVETLRKNQPVIGTKHDQGKPILGAVPPHAELAVGRVLTFGSNKYARGNWDKVEDHENRYMDAALRHLNAHRRGELTDSESGESHLAHAACCILFMLDKQERS